jgi:vacuolar-type H+-ATPase subunit I/STV1
MHRGAAMITSLFSRDHASRDQGGAQAHRDQAGAAAGFIMFASIVMIITGLFDMITGIAGIARNAYYVVSPDYIYRFDVTAWGWTHVSFGLLLVGAGYCLLAGRAWARGLAVVLAAFNAVENFMFMPYSTAWSLLAIVLDVVVIWAIAQESRELA